MKYDVFISHSSADLELSEKICDYLQERGIKCWIDSRNVTGLYAKSIIEGIEQSELMVLVYSGKANTSPHVENEIDNAFCLGKIIIPFRTEGTPYSDVLRYYLNKSHYVDGIPDPLKALDALCNQIKRNMSEQEELEKIDESLKTVAKWLNINVDDVRNCLKKLKQNNTKGDKEEINDKQCRDMQQWWHKTIQWFYSFFNSKSIEISDTSAVSIDDEMGQEKNNGTYEILQNEKGELLIMIEQRNGGPENPRFVYDGSDEALLYRNKESSVILPGLNQEAIDALNKADEILVAETDGEEVAREYIVPIRQVRSLQSIYN